VKNIRTLVICFISFLLINETIAQKKSEAFEFEFEGNKLSGLIESPAEQEPTALAIIVPGSGETNFFAENDFYNGIRSTFISHGIACCFWDKSGCGKSEGKFDGGLEVLEKSVEEINTAMEELKRKKAPGLDKIGLWGISRAGWVCPYVIKKNPSILFWIIVSAPDDKDQSVYFLRNKLIFQGRSEKEIKLLTEEYWKGETIFVSGGSFDEYLIATPNMRKDPTCVAQAGKTDRETYNFYQKKFLSLGYPVNHETGFADNMPGYKAAIASIKCPVLAIFGEKDFIVNWRSTIQLYEETIGTNNSALLTIKTFPNCNHNIQKCKTGAFMENLAEFNYEFCDGYYDAISDWIKSKGLGK
jgi:alpha/beta superfamily hydrolase